MKNELSGLKIVVCTPGNNFSKDFLKCWTKLIDFFCKSGIEYHIKIDYSSNIYYSRCSLLDGRKKEDIHFKPFNGEIDYDYILWIDSDMIFTVDDFKALIRHKVDIVGGVYINISKLFSCGYWDKGFLDSNLKVSLLTRKQLNELVADGKKRNTSLVLVNWTGFGFLLVKKGVFESMEYPWFPAITISTKDNENREIFYEDMAWCKIAGEKGYEIHIDTSVRLGHEKKSTLRIDE